MSLCIAMRSYKRPYFLALFGLLLFIFFIFYALAVDLELYIVDSLIFIATLLLFLYLYPKLHMTPFSYSLLILACTLHNAGVFGWYNISPLPYLDAYWRQQISAHPFQWDHITHVVGVFTATFIVFQYLSQYLKKRQRFHNFFILFLTFLAGMGMGAAIEIYEFAGFMTVGEGAGGLGKGGAGDFTPGDWASSDWLNVMWDLVYNALGGLLAISVGYVMYRRSNSGARSSRA